MRHGKQKRKRVLIVDDEADFRAIVEQWLSPSYDVVSLDHGEGVFDEALMRAPDAFILDVSLPGESGLELCKRLRKQARFRDAPIILLTGIIARECQERGKRAGASAHLTKPVYREVLLHELEELLQGSRSEAP